MYSAPALPPNYTPVGKLLFILDRYFGEYFKYFE